MKTNRKFLIYLSLFLIITLSLWWLWYKLTWEGERYLGELKNPCNNEYSIQLYHYSKFDWAQPLYFEIKKNKKTMGLGNQFAITNNMDESIENFEIHCYDNVLYVTWKDANIPAIIFDTKTHNLYPYEYIKDSYKDDKYKKELFNKIKNRNPKLEFD